MADMSGSEENVRGVNISPLYRRKRSMNTLLHALKSPDIQVYYLMP
jgi:hypothetical protein